jgi:hypothetical protein
MSQRVDEWEWIQYQWPYQLALLGGEGKVSRLAYETGAFTRRRKVECPADLLRLILMWAVGEHSLKETAALAAEAELTDVSDVALLGRFRRSEAWLGALLSEVLTEHNTPPRLALQIRLLDASSISCRGSKGTDRRLHLTMDLGSNRTTGIELTDGHGAEGLDRFQYRSGEVVIADRGYGNRAGLAHVARSGAHFVVRFPWSNVPLEDPDGNEFDLLTALRKLPEAQAGEYAVQVRAPEGDAIPCRLVAIRKSEPAAQQARQKIIADGHRHGNPKIKVRTLEASGYLFVLTNLPADLSAESVLDLYRFRWQIEMKFKMFKSVLHLGNVPTRDGDLANVYLLAKLLVALVIENLIHQHESFSPWGYKISPAQHLASHQTAS